MYSLVNTDANGSSFSPFFIILVIIPIKETQILQSNMHLDS